MSDLFERKHYVAIADTLADVQPKTIREQVIWLRSVHALADLFADDREKFNREMFLAACEGISFDRKNRKLRFRSGATMPMNIGRRA